MPSFRENIKSHFKTYASEDSASFRLNDNFLPQGITNRAHSMYASCSHEERRKELKTGKRKKNSQFSSKFFFFNDASFVFIFWFYKEHSPFSSDHWYFKQLFAATDTRVVYSTHITHQVPGGDQKVVQLRFTQQSGKIPPSPRQQPLGRDAGTQL